MKTKLGIVLFFVLVALVSVFIFRHDGEIGNAKESHFTKPVKKESIITEKVQPGNEEAVKKPSPSPLEERNTRITKEVKEEFNALALPVELPQKRLERHVVVHKYYLKTSFFLNEAAAGNLSPTQDDLGKALKVIAAIKEEMPNDGQLADVLRMVEEDHGAIFNQALRELSKEEETFILKMMDIE